jgi:hypothetical protein
MLDRWAQKTKAARANVKNRMVVPPLWGRKMRAKGRATAAAREATETMRVRKTVPIHAPRATRVAQGARARNAPALVAMPFPPLEPHPEGEHVSHDGGCGVGQRPFPDRRLVTLGKVPDGQPSFQDVHQTHRDGRLPAQHPVGIGGTEISAPFLPEVDAEEEPAHHVAGGGGPQHVGQKDEKEWYHHGIRLPARRIIGPGFP